MKMSITRALAEIKRIDDSVQRELSGSTFVAVSIGLNANAKLMGVGTIEQTKAKIQSSFDSLNNLFVKRERLKAAVVRSNAATTITLGNKVVTVAEAIELKKSIESKRSLLNTMQYALQNARNVVATQSAKLETEIETSYQNLLGNEKGKVDSDMLATITKSKREQKEPALIDPLNIEGKIEWLTKEVSLVDTELDFLLSEANAKTEIEVDF